jgi:hypothetical protein
VKRYTLVINWQGWQAFEREVEEHLNSGWQCQGGVVYMRAEENSGWAQAMVADVPQGIT